MSEGCPDPCAARAHSPGPATGFGAYLRLLRTPGAAALGLWGMIGRFPIAMRPLSCLMLITARTGSLGAAGLVAAAMIVAQGAAGPVLGRLADRRGQRRILLTAAAVHAAAMALLLAAIYAPAPAWLLAVTALAPGASSVSFTSFMRARWPAMVEQAAVRTAYAVESMLDDMIFLLGPLLVTALAAALSPVSGLIAATALTVAGSLGVALHRRSEPARPAGRDAHAPRRAVSLTAVRVMMIVYLGMAFQFGAVDVALVAFGQQRAAPGLGGVLLAIEACGSLIGGLVFGAITWRLAQPRLLAATSGLLALGVLPLLFARTPPAAAALAAVAGLMISPALITGSTVLQALAPQDRLAEAFSWLASMGALGIASGTAVGGRLAAAGGSRHALYAALGGGLLALTLSAAGQRVLTPRRRAAGRAPDLAAQR